MLIKLEEGVGTMNVEYAPREATLTLILHIGAEIVPVDKLPLEKEVKAVQNVILQVRRTYTGTVFYLLKF